MSGGAISHSSREVADPARAHLEDEVAGLLVARSTVSGRPELVVEGAGAWPRSARASASTRASMSLALVLPWEPVIATTASGDVGVSRSPRAQHGARELLEGGLDVLDEHRRRPRWRASRAPRRHRPRRRPARSRGRRRAPRRRRRTVPRAPARGCRGRPARRPRRSGSASTTRPPTMPATSPRLSGITARLLQRRAQLVAVVEGVHGALRSPARSRGPCRRSGRCRRSEPSRPPAGWPPGGHRPRAPRHPGPRRRRRAAPPGSRAGSSVRGLSSVTTSTSASRAPISPITGRLPVSRSPPAPMTSTSRPGGQRPQRCERRLDRVRLVRVVDDREEVLAARRPARAGRVRRRRGRSRRRPGAGQPGLPGQGDRAQGVGDVELPRQRDPGREALALSVSPR